MIETPTVAEADARDVAAAAPPREPERDFSVYNLDPAPDDPIRRPPPSRPDLPRFA